jgi:hypothetical protein
MVLVDAKDSFGRTVSKGNVQSGLGYDYRIRLHVTLSEKLKGDSLPDNLEIDLSPTRNLTLSEFKTLNEGFEFIFLLKGESYKPVISVFFQREIGEKEQVIDLLQR